MQTWIQHTTRSLITKALVISIALLSTPIITTAQNNNIEYYNAYKLCSPKAHQLTKRQCNFGNVFKDYYLQCMQSQGYSENDDEQIAQDDYDNYLKTYYHCASISEQNTKTYCSYGRAYKKHYNQCMIKYGFNKHGEKITDKEEPHKFEFNF